MRTITLALSILLLLFSCRLEGEDTRTEDPCLSNTPLEDITWLKVLKTEFEQDTLLQSESITRYTYNGERVYYVKLVECCDLFEYVINCEQDTLCIFGGFSGLNTCPGFFNEATDKLILYQE